MEDTCTYLVTLCGRSDIDEVNLMSPLHMSHVNGATVSVRTDQSGIIGLMRYLHGLGIVIQSIERKSDHV